MMSERRFLFVFMILMSLTPVIAVEIPRFLAFWPILIGCGASAWFFFGLKEKPRIPKTYLICAGMISCLSAFSALWALSPENSFHDALKVSCLLLGGGVFVSVCQRLRYEDIQYYLYLIPFGVLCAILLLMIELLFDMPVYRIIRSIDSTERTNTAELNRGIISVVLFYFVSLRVIHHLCAGHFKQLLMSSSVLTVGVCAVLYFSQSQAAQLAFLCGIILILTFPARYKTSFYVVAGVIILGMISTPYLVSFLYDSLIDMGQNLPWLKDAYAGNRVEIWNFVMNYAMENPLYGFGIEATRYVVAFAHEHIHHKSDTVLHPHNFSVQIWMEFGFIGICVASMVVFLICKKIADVGHISDKKNFMTIFLLIILVGSVAYGMWQSWWLGLLVFLCGQMHFPMHKKQDKDAFSV